MSVKTLAIRLDSELHARISILARLAELSVTDAIRVAIENHVEVMAADPAVAAKAATLREQIAREAADQQTALYPRSPRTQRPWICALSPNWPISPNLSCTCGRPTSSTPRTWPNCNGWLSCSKSTRSTWQNWRATTRKQPCRRCSRI